jgi:CheY-like chemotaxis protein
VDDHHDIREGLAEFFTDEGYTVLTAANGQEALEALERHPDACLILLDLTMPVMDGWEFRRRQRADPALASAPVLVLTGLRDDSRAAELDPVARITKPADLSHLARLVERYCRRGASAP